MCADKSGIQLEDQKWQTEANVKRWTYEGL